jgi:hypothetical protein
MTDSKKFKYCAIRIGIICLLLFIFQTSCNLDQGTKKNSIYEMLVDEIDKVASNENKESAIKAMVERIPYSPKIRELQKKAEELYTSLKGDENTSRAVNAGMQDILTEMLKDPGYVEIQNNLKDLLIPAEPETTKAISGFSNLKRGDVMCVRSGLFDWMMFIYAMTFSHTGNYDGDDMVYESLPDGVRLQPLSLWKQSGQYIALGRNNKKSSTSVQSALDWAKGKYGTFGTTPYNYFYPDKWTDDRLYCSQLTYKIHMHAGTDLDSNDWTYHLWIALRLGLWAVPAIALPAVAPDEVYLSPHLSIYAIGWN